MRAFRAGAMAYLTKQAAPDELARAVKQVLAGRMYVTPSLGEYMASNLTKHPTRPGHHTLSERELEVLVLLAQGQLRQAHCRVPRSEYEDGEHVSRQASGQTPTHDHGGTDPLCPRPSPG